MYIDAMYKGKGHWVPYVTNCINCMCYNYDMRICITCLYMILKY